MSYHYSFIQLLEFCWQFFLVEEHMSKLKSLAALMSFASAGAFASDVISLEDIIKITSVCYSVNSPFGYHVVFTRSVPRELYVDKNGSHYSELFVTDSKGNERPFITGKVKVGAIEWSADGKFVYFLAKFKDDKFIETVGRKIRILDLKSLKAMRF